MSIQIPSHLTDTQLTAEVASLARFARQTTAQLIAHLAEFDARRLYLGAGFSSLFAYCTSVLRLSENEAYNRIEVARVARRYPHILDRLADGSLNVTAVRLLAPHLTDDTQRDLFASATGKSRREIEELLARVAPRPDVPFSVRKLPTPVMAPAPVMAASVAVAAPMATPDPATAVPERRPIMAPLAPNRYEIRFTATAEMCEDLRLAKDMLRHAVPSGDTAAIFQRALKLLLAELARQKFAATPKPRPGRGTKPGSRHIAAVIRRAVWLRDRGRCAFIGTGGHRCSALAFVEFHHLEPHAVGGVATVDNIQLRCRAHNGYEAELFYGKDRMDARRTRSRTSSVVGERQGAYVTSMSALHASRSPQMPVGT
jgi:hypothetical protein